MVIDLSLISPYILYWKVIVLFQYIYSSHMGIFRLCKKCHNISQKNKEKEYIGIFDFISVVNSLKNVEP